VLSTPYVWRMFAPFASFQSPYVALHGAAFLMLISFSPVLLGQSYTAWRTGAAESVDADPTFGVVLMGGASEDANAMGWFLSRADGGDVLVLRASGSDGYNEFLYEDIGVPLNSVETIRCDGPGCASDPYVLGRIAEAEAVWLAGGNQQDYVSLWRGTAVEDALHALVFDRHGVIGGTSAGMAVLGWGYFGAASGTVYSSEALEDPYNEDMDVAYGDFLRLPWLERVVTDSHYNDPDRRGRHMAFMARLATDHGIAPLGIAADEYVAVCIDESGWARVFGSYPDYEEFAYFVRGVCDELIDIPGPVCQPGQPLIWGDAGTALHVWRADARQYGNSGLQLSDWVETTGTGEWQYWWAPGDGTLATVTSDASQAGPDCTVGLPSEPALLQAGRPLLTGSALPDGRVRIAWHGVDSVTAQWRDLSGRTVSTSVLRPGVQIIERASALLCAEGAVLFLGLGITH